MTKPPLSGIRVADFGINIFDPWAAQILGILGAEVIKIESHANLDTLRTYPPFADDMQSVNRSALFNNLNFSKKSCTINLKHPKGVALAKELIKISDVVLRSHSPNQGEVPGKPLLGIAPERGHAPCRTIWNRSLTSVRETRKKSTPCTMRCSDSTEAWKNGAGSFGTTPFPS